MPYDFLLINLGYGIVFLALAIKEVLWLRITLSIAQSIILYNNLYIAESYITAGWNSVFVLVNIVQVIIIYNDRKPRYIPDEYFDLYNGVFKTFSSKEFLYLLNMGNVIEIQNEHLITSGNKQDDLLLMLEGNCLIKRDGKNIANLNRGQFVGELSFITSQPASADAYAEGKIKYLAWNQSQLKTIKNTNPAFYAKFHHALTEDIANKMIK